MNERFRQWLNRQVRINRYSNRTLEPEFPPYAGVSHTTIGRWRRGEIDPSPEHVRVLARIFGVKPRYLFEMLGWLEPEDDITVEQRMLIEAISKLTDEEVVLVNRMINGLLSAQADTGISSPDPQRKEAERSDIAETAS